MQSFLKDAEQKQVVDQRVQQWVFEINSVANDAIAILETYSLEASKGNDARFASRLKACTCICRKETKFYNDVVQTLLAELLKAELHRSVISIYGMGGLGKTTLGRNLYISPNIVSSFPTRAWICVSQEYNTMDLLRIIIKSIQGCTKETLNLLEKMTERDLEICQLRSSSVSCTLVFFQKIMWSMLITYYGCGWLKDFYQQEKK
ncbi:hypothetical protein KY289_019698 [Solanum tuberosum]|nr:hypothetical protein KY289_019698 [Solanum tuberosum]